MIARVQMDLHNLWQKLLVKLVFARGCIVVPVHDVSQYIVSCATIALEKRPLVPVFLQKLPFLLRVGLSHP
jgi:hypothetical protein